MANAIRKRLALALATALGASTLVAVAATPASAGEATTAKVASVALGSASVSGRVGSAVTTTVSFTGGSSANALGNDDSVTLRAVLTARPAGSTAAVSFNTTGRSLADTTPTVAPTSTVTAANAAGNELLPVKLVADPSNGEAFTSAAQTPGSVGVIPDVVGTYEFVVWHDQDSDGAVDTAEKKAEGAFVIGAAPVSVSATWVNQTAATGSNGALMKLSLLDSAGKPAALAAGEAVLVDPPTGVTVAKVQNVAVSGAAAGAVATLNNTSFDAKGVSYINFTAAAAAEAVSISITGSGGAIATLTGVTTVTFVVADSDANGTIDFGDSGKDGFATSATDIGAATGDTVGTDITVPVGSSTLTFEFTGAATSPAIAEDAYIGFAVTDNSGRVFGLAGVAADLVSAVNEDLVGSVSVTMAATAIDNFYTIAKIGMSATTFATREVVADAVDVEGGTVTASPSLPITAAPGGTVNYTVTVRDQFGRLAPNVAVTMSISGRNGTTAATETTVATNATGQASFSVKDAPAAGVTRTDDTITWTAVGALGSKTGTASITWVAQTVGSVAFSAFPGRLDTVAGTTTTDISAAATGATGKSAALTVTVKDAAGNLLAGVPVTFSVSGLTGAEVHTTLATVYTKADGTAATAVSSYAAGKATVKAVAGAREATADIYFAQADANEARTITATVNGNLVTATVADRFGNPIQNVDVLATKVGAGYFGQGTSSATGKTDKNGKVEFVIVGGAATVSVSFANAEFGQSDDEAGKVGTTAVTAYVAGTSTANQRGLGGNLAPAGVNSATVTVAAPVDTAAQAAAANATAIARVQEQVTALAASVTSLIAALSAQVKRLQTALTNVRRLIRSL